MTLLSMLIALVVERLAVRSPQWQLVSYLRPYLTYANHAPFSMFTQPQAGLWLWCLLPAVGISLLLHAVDFWLFTLVVNTIVLLLCMGCWHYRQLYKQYLNAAARDDQQAAFFTMQQLETDAGISQLQLSYGQRLVWLNFKYYAAVLFWFALLGAFGALTYAILRLLTEPATYIKVAEAVTGETDHSEAQQSAAVDADTDADFAPATSSVEVEQQPNATASAVDADAAQDLQQLKARAEHLSQGIELQRRLTAIATDLSHWADWLPARLFGLGFALVGHFSRASTILLSHLGDSSTPAGTVLTEIAKAAEPLPEEQLNCTNESCSLVQLSKRNILFFLALVAILTLSGALS